MRTAATGIARAVDHHSSFARQTAAGSFVYLVGGIRTRAQDGAESNQRLRLDGGRLQAVDGVETAPRTDGSTARVFVGHLL